MSNIDYKYKYIKYKKKYLRTLTEMEAGDKPIVKHPYDDPEKFSEKKYKRLKDIVKIMEDLVDNNRKFMDEEKGISWESLPEEVKKFMRTKSFGVGDEGKRDLLAHYDSFIRKAGNILYQARKWLDKTPEQREEEKEREAKEKKEREEREAKERLEREEKEKKKEEKRRKKAEEREIEAEKQLQEYRARKLAEKEAKEARKEAERVAKAQKKAAKAEKKAKKEAKKAA